MGDFGSPGFLLDKPVRRVLEVWDPLNHLTQASGGITLFLLPTATLSKMHSQGEERRGDKARKESDSAPAS